MYRKDKLVIFKSPVILGSRQVTFQWSQAGFPRLSWIINLQYFDKKPSYPQHINCQKAASKCGCPLAFSKARSHKRK